MATNKRVIWVVEVRMEKRTVDDRGGRPSKLTKELYLSHYNPCFQTEADATAAYKAADAALSSSLKGGR